MQYMQKLLSIAALAVLVSPFQLALAQTTQEGQVIMEQAELALAIEIAKRLNSDDNPDNDVAVPADAAAAKAVIAAAPAPVVTSAVSALAVGLSGSQPGIPASTLAAAAAVNNDAVSPSVAAEVASAASGLAITTAAVQADAVAAGLAPAPAAAAPAAAAATGPAGGTGAIAAPGGAGGGGLAQADVTAAIEETAVTPQEVLAALGVENAETVKQVLEEIESATATPTDGDGVSPQ